MDEPTQANESYLAAGPVKAQSPLSTLLDTQEKTGELLRILADKLSPVSNPHPTDTAKAIGDRGYHIESAVFKQREINEAISYMLDTVVL